MNIFFREWNIPEDLNPWIQLKKTDKRINRNFRMRRKNRDNRQFKKGKKIFAAGSGRETDRKVSPVNSLLVSTARRGAMAEKFRINGYMVRFATGTDVVKN